MSKPTITVIVPVYKAMATLDRCVESVVSQDVAGGLACILVDDGSPDDSGKLCDAWAARDPRVTVIHQDDLGVSGARNSGLAAADSEYIVFLDSDDALRPGALQAALDAQNAAPNSFDCWHYTTDENDTAPVTAAHCPQEDMRPLHRAELTVFAEGIADILRRDPAKSARVRRDKAIAALRSPWMHALLERMKIEGAYSAYYLPCRWHSTRLIWALAEAKRTGSPLYGKLDWAGYYLLRGKMRRD